MTSFAKPVAILCALLLLASCAEKDRTRAVSTKQVNIRGSDYEVVRTVIKRRIEHSGLDERFARVSETWEINDGFNNYYRCPTPDVEGCKKALDRRGRGDGGEGGSGGTS